MWIKVLAFGGTASVTLALSKELTKSISSTGEDPWIDALSDLMDEVVDGLNHTRHDIRCETGPTRYESDDALQINTLAELDLALRLLRALFF